MASTKSLADSRVFKAGFNHVKRNDPRLKPILERRGLIEFQPGGEPFESLIESILSQQVAGAAAEAIINKVRGLYPDGALKPERIYSMDASRLRRAGVSPQKLSYLKDLSSRVSEGRLDLEALSLLPDERIIEVLDDVKGIGPWTAHMFLIFTLGRPDVLPVDDYGIRTSVQSVYRLRKLPSKETIERIAERWHPYSTVASLYLWNAKDTR